MALIARVPIVDVATAAARGLEAVLGHDVMLTTGPPAFGPPSVDTLPTGTTRCVVLPFVNGVVGEVTLVVAEHFATTLEAITPDAELVNACVPVLAGAAEAIESVVHVDASADAAGEISTETLLTSVVGDFAAVPILEGDACVACVIVRIVDEPAPAAAPAPPPPAPMEAPVAPAAAPAVTIPPPAPIAAPAPVVLAGEEASGPAAGTGIARHEFLPLADGQGALAQARSLTLLNDVTTEVTAELGRRRVKVREIVALQPGSVIVLEKAAGSPVDVMVNGSLVWHGEVVVVDDEFGIRVSEIVVDET
jgi:flagellar motor switch protein FliN/FliY